MVQRGRLNTARTTETAPNWNKWEKDNTISGFNSNCQSNSSLQKNLSLPWDNVVDEKKKKWQKGSSLSLCHYDYYFIIF